MRRPIASLAATVAAVFLACALAPGPTARATDAGSKPVAATASKEEKVQRGRYLLATGGCSNCHTPWKKGKNGPEPDPKFMLAGHPEGLVMPPVPQLPAGPWVVVSSDTNTAWAGAWGVSFTANLTPDPETGLGQWNVRQFIGTMRTGRHLGVGREVLPPMPTNAYANFSDDDLEALFGYLQSIPPVRNRVPQPIPPGGRSGAAKK